MALEIVHASNNSLGNPESCSKYTTAVGKEVQTWVPVVLKDYTPSNGEYVWMDDRPSANGEHIKSMNWVKSQPNGVGKDKCVYKIEHNRWIDGPCNVPICSFCTIPMSQTFYLRGSQKLGLENKYFLSMVMQDDSSKIIFEGRGASQISWYPSEKRTEILVHGLNRTFQFDKYPFGLLEHWDESRLRQYGEPLMLSFTNVILLK